MMPVCGLWGPPAAPQPARRIGSPQAAPQRPVLRVSAARAFTLHGMPCALLRDCGEWSRMVHGRRAGSQPLRAPGQPAEAAHQ